MLKKSNINDDIRQDSFKDMNFKNCQNPSMD